ncbi:spike protein [Alphacoronavirus Bat-CoV/P.kuhlii/Italy/206679-3/2010]|nr:spike protein [Alphacoronavirus Bat-CoV/P.kuhlii/Italy/206679-3/2010]
MNLFIVVLCALTSLVRPQGTPCQPTTGMKIQLGLPPNRTVYVSGYLPLPNNWTCLSANNQGPVFNRVVGKARAVYIRYIQGGYAMSFGVGPSSVQNFNGYSLYVTQKNDVFVGNRQGAMDIRICKYKKNKDPAQRPSGGLTDTEGCLFADTIYFAFGTGIPHGYEVIGVSWTGDAVTVHGKTKMFRIFVPGADKWDSVSVNCQNSWSCAQQIITEPVTIIATTAPNGTIVNYTRCANCKGFPDHVFAVEEGGEIPVSFSFGNWFYLSDGSSPIGGRFYSSQPLKLMCLWPVPALVSNTGVIYFNYSKHDLTGHNGDFAKRCNGYFEEDFVATHLRFAINSTGHLQTGHLSLVSVNNTFNLTCSNTSDFQSLPFNYTGFGIPFGKTDQPYYCFVTQGNDTQYSNRTFVGVMPADVRELVVSITGAVYVNGYRLFSVGPVEGVLLNLTSLTGSDFWTVAYTKEVNVLVDIENTNIKAVLYCNDPLNRLKCQQQRFFLDDGFYSSAEVAQPIQKSVVLLPEYSGLTEFNVSVTANWKQGNGACIQCPPLNYNITLNGATDGAVCVAHNRFTVNFQYYVDSGFYKIISGHGTCPFTLDKLNNFLKFGSLCISLKDNGGCTIPLVAKNYVDIDFPFATLYVSYIDGGLMTGVPPGFAKNLGFYDASVLHLNVCTEYNIYGYAGKGVITPSNSTYLAGISYSDSSGALVSFKNTTTGEVFSIRPCQTSRQFAVINDNIVGVISASSDINVSFNHTIETPTFYYHANTARNCTNPVLTYATIGICADGAMGYVYPTAVKAPPATPIVTGNISIPVNFTVSVQAEYVQVSIRPVVVDCATFVCNGNERCLQLLKQYVTACSSIENALALNARLESQDVASLLTYDEAAYRQALELKTSQFQNDFNISAVLPAAQGKGSFIEDLLFDKVITTGLGTVEADYKACIERAGTAAADITCRQYYNGISVLPALTDDGRLGLYSASLMGGITLGAFFGGAVALPFSLAVFSKLNYLALQTDAIQENQKILANAFNTAMGNITNAFTDVNNAIQQTGDAIKTVANALNKVQEAVNTQGAALEKLTAQLALNFEAISSSIEDIYNRLDALAADAQVDRLINGRLAALSTFTSSQLVKYSEVKSSRALALQKVNECVKSQSSRYGFCGNGTHLFSMVTGAPEGLLFLHTVLLPTEYRQVESWAGLCVSNKAYVLRDVQQVLYKYNDSYFVTPRNMFQPRVPVVADFVQIQSCAVTYVNLTTEEFETIVPDFIDVNKTLQDLVDALPKPNYTLPNFPLDQFNHTYLNLTAQIGELEARALALENISARLQGHIDSINNTLVDLEWLDRFETYIKWPWYVWLAIFVVLIILAGLMLWCCIATGCCGCCSCITASCAGCCDCRGRNLQRYEVEKVHVQ